MDKKGKDYSELLGPETGTAVELCGTTSASVHNTKNILHNCVLNAADVKFLCIVVCMFATF